MNLLRGNQVFSPLRYVEFSPQRTQSRRALESASERPFRAQSRRDGLNLAQDVSPGLGRERCLVPQGRLKGLQQSWVCRTMRLGVDIPDCVLG
jgi:hypothetical protein